jgi:ABC-type multidrug transport system ATPase subunit
MRLIMDNLSKQYRNGTWGLESLSLTLETGTVGVVGPVGAGKTTLLRMLATVIRPTKGTVMWSGTDGGQLQDVHKRPNAFRHVMGYVPQDLDVYANLSGQAFLQYVAAMRAGSAQARVRAVIRQVGLTNVAGQKMGRYSNEQKRRVGLAQALLGDPHLLLIDEPAASLAVQERSRFGSLLAQVVGDARRLVVIASDDIVDISAIATVVVMLKEGRLVLKTTPAELLRSVDERVWSVTVGQERLVEMRRERLISQVVRQGARVHLKIVSEQHPHPDAVLAVPTLSDAYAYHIHRKG